MIAAVFAFDVRLSAFTHDSTLLWQDYPFPASAVLALTVWKSLLQCQLARHTKWIHRKQYVLRFNGFEYGLVEFDLAHGFVFIKVQTKSQFAANNLFATVGHYHFNSLVIVNSKFGNG